LIFFLTAAAETALSRAISRQAVADQSFRWRGLRSQHFFTAVVVGLTLTFFFAAYQILFYLVSRKFGGWRPRISPTTTC
jgi:hypothetical protein